MDRTPLLADLTAAEREKREQNAIGRVQLSMGLLEGLPRTLLVELRIVLERAERCTGHPS